MADKIFVKGSTISTTENLHDIFYKIFVSGDNGKDNLEKLSLACALTMWANNIPGVECIEDAEERYRITYKADCTKCPLTLECGLCRYYE